MVHTQLSLEREIKETCVWKLVVDTDLEKERTHRGEQTLPDHSIPCYFCNGENKLCKKYVGM